MSELSFHAVEDSGSNQRTEGIANETAARQKGSANTQFGALVPLREQEQGAGEEGGLHKSKEEPSEQSTNKTRIVRLADLPACSYFRDLLVRDTSQNRDETPNNHTAWEID